MRSNRVFLSATAALLVGLVQSFFLIWCWAYIANYSPVVGWLLSLGLRGGALQGILFPIDLATSVFLSLPAAWVLAQLRPKAASLYLVLAVLPSFVWSNRLVLGGSAALPVSQLSLSWLSQLLTLPVAFWVAQRWTGGSNKSFKPKPLRGSA